MIVISTRLNSSVAPVALDIDRILASPNRLRIADVTQVKTPAIIFRTRTLNPVPI